VRLMMTETDVAKLCGVHVQTVRRWRRLGTGPPWLRRGRQVVYDPDVVRAWWYDRRRPRRRAPGTPTGNTLDGLRGGRPDPIKVKTRSLSAINA
jgi:hypothetical protein